MLLFSIMYDVSLSKDEPLKPNTICLYNKIKQAVNVVDMKIRKYTTKMKTRRWSINTFNFAFDNCRTNMQIQFSKKLLGKS